MTDLADLAGLSPDEFQRFLDEAPPDVQEELEAILRAALRPDPPRLLPHQRPPDGMWDEWWLLAGRGAGKTLAAALWMDRHVQGPPCDPRLPGGHRLAIVAPTQGDGMDACLHGPSGLLAVNPAIRIGGGGPRGVLAVWPSGAEARLFGVHTDNDVQRLRAGGNRCGAWCEEVAAWRHLGEGLDHLRLGLRVGPHPQMVLSTTPRNRAEVRDAKRVSQSDPRIVVVGASTYDNPHLAAEVRKRLLDRYEGTRLGRAELHGELVDDSGDVFSRAWFQFIKESPADDEAGWVRVRAWDLAATEGEEDRVLAGRDRENDPDWTVGTRLAWNAAKRLLVVEDVTRIRRGPGAVKDHVIHTAQVDGRGVTVVVEQDPGQAGKSQMSDFRALLAGIAPFHEQTPLGSKPVRADLAAGLAEQRRALVVPGPWVPDWLDELEEFTRDDSHRHDDQVDSLSAGVAYLVGRPRRKMMTGR